MTFKIAYSGLKDKYLKGIQTKLSGEQAAFSQLPYEDYRSLIKTPQKDALLIGEEDVNPIRLAQEAYSYDKSLSILIISDPDNYARMKKTLLFTPFIGDSVFCVSDGDDTQLSNMVRDLIQKTHQRRKYDSLRKAGIHVQTLPKKEQLKKEYINRFFEKAPVGAVLLDDSSVIMGLNRSASKVLNIPETALIGNKLNNFFPANVRSRINTFLREGYKNDAAKSFKQSDHPEKHIEVAVSEIEMQGAMEYKIAIINDITDKILKEKQISQQVEELEKINTDLDNFIYTASHDLKAPISNLEGLINTLAEVERGTEEYKEIFNMIRKSVTRFRSTIQDLSDIAKVQKGVEQDIEDIDVKEAIEEVLTSLDKDIRQISADVQLKLDRCFSVRMSKANFRSIIFNLISNALKYHSPERKPEIMVSCHRVSGCVLLEVADNGLGIREAHLQKIFTMFKRFRAHVEGTGIGLYIVKRIVDNIGGHIKVKSELNKGTTFSVYLQVKDPDEEQD